MKTHSFSKRIALNFMATTAILIILIFSSIYLVVFRTVYKHLNDDLEAEYLEISHNIVILDNQLIFANETEWNEPEHAQIEVNPTFIQVTDTTGQIIKRSSNLRTSSLPVLKNEAQETFFDTKLSGSGVRQLQVVLKDENNRKAGFISIAIPLDESQMVLKNLFTILLSLFPIVLLVLYFTSRFIAQKSISPVGLLTDSASKISRENLNERLPLPARKDELYILTGTINKLLDRIEQTLIREKQFSSDASHELRTPLSVLKGTLDLMLRKPREPEYYIEKSGTCLAEVNRMAVLVDQLLLLARYSNKSNSKKETVVNLYELIDQVINRHVQTIETKDISIFRDIDKNLMVRTDVFMLEQIVENIFSNALKYSYSDSTVGMIAFRKDGEIRLTIKDEGIGMNEDELQYIFNRFFRADESRSSQTKGFGLGLAIAKGFADILSLKINVKSCPGAGSSFTIIFNKSDNAS
jgi:signal transduction histidine kinase